MPSKHNMEKAAQAWCAPTTQHLTMPPELATEFAKMLDETLPIPPVDDIGWNANLIMAMRDCGVPRKQAEDAARRFMGWLTIRPCLAQEDADANQ